MAQSIAHAHRTLGIADATTTPSRTPAHAVHLEVSLQVGTSAPLPPPHKARYVAWRALVRSVLQGVTEELSRASHAALQPRRRRESPLIDLGLRSPVSPEMHSQSVASLLDLM